MEPSKPFNKEFPFCDTPEFTKTSWTLAYNFLFKSGEALIRRSRDMFILTKSSNRSFINGLYVAGKYRAITCNFDEFIKLFENIHLVELNKENWAKSTCNCSWFLKNYHCFHVIAIAVNEKLVEFPVEYKDVVIGAKVKRGRKSKAKSALEKQNI